MSTQLRRSSMFAGGFFLGLLLVFAGIWLAVAPQPSAGADPESPARAAAQPTVQALWRTGITPASLAAAGVDSGSVPGAVIAASESVFANAASLAAADEAVASAAASLEGLQRSIRAGLASDGDVALATAARESLDAAVTHRDTLLATIRSAALAGVSGQQAAIISTLHANRGHPVPMSFRASERADAEWAALRDAADAERICAAKGLELCDGAESLLAETRAEIATANAAANLETRLTAVQQAFDSAIAGL